MHRVLHSSTSFWIFTLHCWTIARICLLLVLLQPSVKLWIMPYLLYVMEYIESPQFRGLPCLSGTLQGPCLWLHDAIMIYYICICGIIWLFRLDSRTCGMLRQWQPMVLQFAHPFVSSWPRRRSQTARLPVIFSEHVKNSLRMFKTC